MIGRIKKIRKIVEVFASIIFIILLFACDKTIKFTDTNSEKSIRIITTSDLHGKMLPWDYLLNEEEKSGSLAQIATVLKEIRTDNSVLVDVGDVIQDNAGELFLNEPIHPMIMAMNIIGYDVCTVGNHEFNFGMDIVKKTIARNNAKVVLSNVYDENGKRLAEPYTIIERNGIKIAFIGVITPNILKWDKENLKGYTVTNPVNEVNAIVKEIEKSVDVFVVVAHMAEENELGTSFSGIRDLAENCEKIDFICAGHGHLEVFNKKMNNCPYVENKKMGQTVMVSDIKLKNINGKWKVNDVVSQSIKVSEYDADEGLVELLKPYDERAKDDANAVIGKLVGGPMVEESVITGIPRVLIEDTALITFQHDVIKNYVDVDISTAMITSPNDNIKEGNITKSDINKVYKFYNTLYKLKMTGSQLKKWMESCASFYRQSSKGDLTIGFNNKNFKNNLYFFSGINFDINISKPVGERIENLIWSNGRKVEDEDVFTIATTDYCANTVLTIPGEIYSAKDEMPEIIEKDIRVDIGGINNLMKDYIINVKNGTIVARKDNNWKITGIEFDIEKQKEINELIKSGKLKFKGLYDMRYNSDTIITEEMYNEAKKK